MGRFWRTFWWCIGSFGALVGLYIGAATAGLGLAFWIVFAVSLSVAGIVSVGPRAATWIQHIRNYPDLLKRAGELQAEVAAWKATADSLKRAALSQREEAIAEGRSQVYGAIRANSVATPTLVGKAVVNGSAVVLGRCSPQEFLAGSRYHLEVAVSGESKGVVEARDYDEERQIVALVCVNRASPNYWREFVERAETDPAPPVGMRLRPLDLSGEVPPSVQAIESTPPTEEKK